MSNTDSFSLSYDIKVQSVMFNTTVVISAQQKPVVNLILVLTVKGL